MTWQSQGKLMVELLISCLLRHVRLLASSLAAFPIYLSRNRQVVLRQFALYQNR